MERRIVQAVSVGNRTYVAGDEAELAKVLRPIEVRYLQAQSPAVIKGDWSDVVAQGRAAKAEAPQKAPNAANVSGFHATSAPAAVDASWKPETVSTSTSTLALEGQQGEQAAAESVGARVATKSVEGERPVDRVAGARSGGKSGRGR